MAGTRSGAWVVWWFVASVLLLALTLVAFNTDLITPLAESPGRQILWVLTALASLGTLITGAVSWLKFGDRSVVVVIATIYGVLATVLLGFGALPQ